MVEIRYGAKNPSLVAKDKEKERTVAFVVARLNSSRFAAKHLRTIGDRSLLSWTLDHISQSRQIDEIVVATVAEASNEPLRGFSMQKGVSCFWFEGDVNHVTERLRRAAETFNADICVLVSGDCPLMHAPAIDYMIHGLKNAPQADFVRVLSDARNNPSALEGVVVARRRAWQLADDIADRPELKEHQFPVIGLRPELFQSIDLSFPEFLCMPRHRLSVDTWADLEFMNRVYAELSLRGKPFELPEVVRLLDEIPGLKEINAHVHQRKLVENIKSVLFIVDTGKAFGFGHLMRSLELALQIVEQLGWSVSFVVDDEKAAHLIEAHGLRVFWGAFARPERNNPGNADTFRLEKILADFDLLVLDVFDQRGPEPGWRLKMSVNIPTVVVENLQSWADEADLIVLPNLLGKEKQLAGDPASVLRDPMGNSSRVRVVGGSDYLILRRSIRQAKNGHAKDIDLLVYLQDGALKKEIADFTDKHMIKAEFLNGFNPQFPDLLARSKLYLSPFGISFNEALALKTLPICWPDSKAHYTDAVRFYRELDIPPYVVNSTAELADAILPLLQLETCCSVSVKDGTSVIVEEMARLVKAA
jgi:spore coat polysaccharide biosynthesis protein SpsF